MLGLKLDNVSKMGPRWISDILSILLRMIDCLYSYLPPYLVSRLWSLSLRRFIGLHVYQCLAH